MDHPDRRGGKISPPPPGCANFLASCRPFRCCVGSLLAMPMMPHLACLRCLPAMRVCSGGSGLPTLPGAVWTFYGDVWPAAALSGVVFPVLALFGSAVTLIKLTPPHRLCMELLWRSRACHNTYLLSGAVLTASPVEVCPTSTHASPHFSPNRSQLFIFEYTFVLHETDRTMVPFPNRTYIP